MVLVPVAEHKCVDGCGVNTKQIRIVEKCFRRETEIDHPAHRHWNEQGGKRGDDQGQPFALACRQLDGIEASFAETDLAVDLHQLQPSLYLVRVDVVETGEASGAMNCETGAERDLTSSPSCRVAREQLSA